MIKRFETPYMADWFAITLRWIMVVGLFVSLGLGQRLEIASTWPLGLMIFWNLAMTALAGLNLRTRYHRRLNILADLLLSGAFFWVQGGVRGPAFWVGLMPILTSSVYFEFWGGLISSLILAGLVFYTGTRLEGSLSLPVAVATILVILGVVFGYIGRSLMAHMRKNRSLWIDAEERKRAIQNERMRAIYELTSTLSSTDRKSVV